MLKIKKYLSFTSLDFPDFLDEIVAFFTLICFGFLYDNRRLYLSRIRNNSAVLIPINPLGGLLISGTLERGLLEKGACKGRALNKFLEDLHLFVKWLLLENSLYILSSQQNEKIM